MIKNLSSRSREEREAQKRRTLYVRFYFAIFLFVILIALVSYVSHRSSIRISQVELSGGVLVSQDKLTEEVLNFTSGSYFWLFPKNNIFLYKKTNLEQDLKEKFPRIDTLKIERKNFHTLLVTITERKPIAQWCGELGSDRCYFIDDLGTVFAESPSFSGDAYFKYYGVMSTSTKFSEVSDFIENVRSLGLKPQYLLFKDDNSYSLSISGGGQIYFDDREPFTKTFENLNLLLKNLLQNPDVAKSGVGNLPVEYLDLRFGNKLYYKLKSQ
jgi:cell division septal protein FtsQ